MSQRIRDNLHKRGYDLGENRGNLLAICPAYCQKCGFIFMGDNCTDKICKNCKDKK